MRWTVVVAALAMLAALWISAVPALVYFEAVGAFSSAHSANSLGLDRYRVTIERQPIGGIGDNLSGLSYSNKTGTLFAVTNRPTQVVELSTDGHLLRTIALEGATDPEGITHVDGDRFIIADEGSQSLHWVTIRPNLSRLSLDGGERLKLNIGAMHNMGFEGLSWDASHQRLYVTQEMFPARVIVINGLEADAGLRLEIDEWRPKNWAGAFLIDLSSVSLHEPTGNLLLLSHMASMLVEHDPEGNVLSTLPLWRGWHGLERSVGQAEGVAVGPQGEIFIVSEPNLFYRFERL